MKVDRHGSDEFEGWVDVKINSLVELSIDLAVYLSFYLPIYLSISLSITAVCTRSWGQTQKIIYPCSVDSDKLNGSSEGCGSELTLLVSLIFFKKTRLKGCSARRSIKLLLSSYGDDGGEACAVIFCCFFARIYADQSSDFQDLRGELWGVSVGFRGSFFFSNLNLLGICMHATSCVDVNFAHSCLPCQNH